MEHLKEKSKLAKTLTKQIALFLIYFMLKNNKYLLDTHVLLWWLSADKQLGSSARKMIASTDNQIFCSVASYWEMVIKQSLGKLSFPKKTFTTLEENGILILPIEAKHIAELQSLPTIHKDPFDRILIAQAINEKMTLVTGDKHIQKYKIDTLEATV